MTLTLADGFMSISATQCAVFLAALAIIFSIRRWRMNVLKKQKQGNAASREISPSAARIPSENQLSVREVTAEIQALLIDLEETARRVAAQIDNRRVRVEQLMVDADAKIKRLESLTRQTSSPAPLPVPAPSPVSLPSLSPSPASPSSATPRDATQMLNRLRQERGAPPAKEDPAYQPIYKLADQGKNAREIGQALNRQPGEIELILALRGRQPV